MYSNSPSNIERSAEESSKKEKIHTSAQMKYTWSHRKMLRRYENTLNKVNKTFCYQRKKIKEKKKINKTEKYRETNFHSFLNKIWDLSRHRPFIFGISFGICVALLV